MFISPKTKSLYEEYMNEADRRRELEAQIAKKSEEQRQAYIEWNNLYLQVQRHEVKMSITVKNRLETLITAIWDQKDPIREWAEKELWKLPHFFDY